MGGLLNKRLLRLALALQQFDIRIEYRPGKDHANADGMSRQAWPSSDVQSAQVCISDLSPSQILGGEMWAEDQRKRRNKERR